MKPSQLVIITDLDGTLLDQKTYSYKASLPVIEKLKSLRIPLILCSSKTQSEIVFLWQELGLKDPFISENGGAIYLLPNYFSFSIQGLEFIDGWAVITFGTKVSALRRTLTAAAKRSCVRIRSFGSMGPGEISELTGLSKEQAALARKREFDEPFIVEEGGSDCLISTLRASGMEVIQGGEFFHVTGGHDKGNAVKALLDLFRRSRPELLTVGLGNSANDLPFLTQVDIAVLVRNIDGSYNHEAGDKIRHIKRTQKSGTAGWREAVEEILADVAS
ncbi:MAG: HAD-IIB family hydrolase [Candidatus Binatia bacterium]